MYRDLSPVLANTSVPCACGLSPFGWNTTGWQIWCPQHFRYLKWRNPHHNKLYGYGLCKGTSTLQNSLKKRFRTSIWSGYLKLLVTWCSKLPPNKWPELAPKYIHQKPLDFWRVNRNIPQKNTALWGNYGNFHICVISHFRANCINSFLKRYIGNHLPSEWARTSNFEVLTKTRTPHFFL